MHQVKKENGKCLVNACGDWEEISEEEFEELLTGGYELVEDDVLLESENI